MLETKTHLKVKRKFNLGDTSIVHEALLKGEVDMYPEYTGTAYLTILHQHYNPAMQLIPILKNQYLKLKFLCHNR